MGNKRNLGTISITDQSNAFNNGNVDFITVAYDEDDDLIEVFPKAFPEISDTETGYSGDYFEGRSYADTRTTIRGNLRSEGYIDVFVTDTYLYTIEESDDGLGGDPDGIRLIVTQISDGTEVEDNELTSGFSTVQSQGFYVDETNELAYVIESGSYGARVFSTSSGNHLSSNRITPVGSDSWGCWLNESTDKFYMGDNTDQKIYVWDVSTRDSPLRLASEDIDLSAANASITFKCWSYSHNNDRIYVWDTQANTVRSFKVSDQTHQSSEDFAPTYPSDLSSSFDEFFYANDSICLIDTNTTVSIGFNISAYRLSDGVYFDTITSGGNNTANIANEKLSLKGNNCYIQLGDNWVKFDVQIFPSVLIYPRSRDYINDSVGTFWKRNSTNYRFRNGNNVVFFQPFTSPPYFLKRSLPTSEVEIIDEDLINDLRASLVIYTNPSGKSTSDGSITIEADGTNTPFIYQIIGPNNSNVNPQSSGTFNNLPPGEYQFRVTDSNNVNYDLDPFQLRYVEEVLSDYGVFYYHEYYNLDSSEKYRIEIVKRDYSGSASQLNEMGPAPFTLNIEGQGQDIPDTTILSTTATIQFIDSSLYTYLPIAEGNDEDWGVVFYRDESSTFVEKFRGLINPRSYSEDMSSVDHITSFTATDRTGDLSNIKYIEKIDTDTGFTYSSKYLSFYGGRKTAWQVLHYCLRQLNMDMGYRVALDLFEDSHSSGATDNPLTQTKVDTDSYFKASRSIEDFISSTNFTFVSIFNNGERNIKDPIDDVKTLQEVVTSILDPFKAILIAWEGYWYIIDKELLGDSSISYIEYDSNASYVTTGSWSPRIDFKDVNSNNRFRWVDDPIVSSTEIYRDVELKLDTLVIKEGLLRRFSTNNLQSSQSIYGSFSSGFKGWNIKSGSNDNLIFRIENSNGRRINAFYKPVDDDLILRLNLDANGNSNTKIVATGKVSTSISDEFLLKLNLTSLIDLSNRLVPPDVENAELNPSVPYVILKWEFEIGDYHWNSAKGSWETSQVINQLFISDDSEQNFSLNIQGAPISSGETTYRLKIYAPSITEYDLHGGSSESAMLTTLKAVDTTDLTTNNRLIIRYKDTSGDLDVFIHHFYELQYGIPSGSEPDVVTPDDYNISSNPKRWRLIALQSFYDYSSTGSVRLNTITYLKSPELQLLPGGVDIPEEVLVKRKGDSRNKLTYSKTLFHFDAPPNLNSPMELFYNHFFTGSRTPTTLWAKSGGIERRIQDHLADWLVGLLKKSRSIVSASEHSDTFVSPINTFRDPNDNNKIYLLMSGSFDFKNNKIEGGEWVELIDDDGYETSSFSSAFNSSEIS